MTQTTTPFTTEHPSMTGLTETERHSLLLAERRRLALTILAERTTAVRFEDLAAEIAEREDGCDPTDAETVHCIEVTLHHNHLPKMADLGVIDYDRESGHLVHDEGLLLRET